MLYPPYFLKKHPSLQHSSNKTQISAIPSVNGTADTFLLFQNLCFMFCDTGLFRFFQTGALQTDITVFFPF